MYLKYTWNSSLRHGVIVTQLLYAMTIETISHWYMSWLMKSDENYFALILIRIIQLDHSFAQLSWHG